MNEPPGQFVGATCDGDPMNMNEADEIGSRPAP